MQETAAQPWQIQFWPIERFVFYARNPRKNDAAVESSSTRAALLPSRERRVYLKGWLGKEIVMYGFTSRSKLVSADSNGDLAVARADDLAGNNQLERHATF